MFCVTRSVGPDGSIGAPSKSKNEASNLMLCPRTALLWAAIERTPFIVSVSCIIAVPAAKSTRAVEISKSALTASEISRPIGRVAVSSPTAFKKIERTILAIFDENELAYSRVARGKVETARFFARLIKIVASTTASAASDMKWVLAVAMVATAAAEIKIVFSTVREMAARGAVDRRRVLAMTFRKLAAAAAETARTF